MAQDYKNFIDTLIYERGISDLEPEVLDEMRSDLNERLDNWINARILDKLPEEKLPDFEAMLDKNASQEEIIKFVEPYTGDADSFLASILLDFRASFLSGK